MNVHGGRQAGQAVLERWYRLRGGFRMSVWRRFVPWPVDEVEDRSNASSADVSGFALRRSVLDAG